AMLKQVKRTFKPEFINRLSATVIFHDMNQEMASLILNKKLDELATKLEARNIEIELSEEARNHLLKLGFTSTYGAREMDRTIASQLKPMLMREILFGKLKNGGKARIQIKNGQLSLQTIIR
ncbi:MAG: ATP-dependent Clp protease ATP-binding subunit ClpA, partial [Phocaeicola sp.]|nr:ATP-dependent Clp protease ATP-binding subunit ClpA [Phocaeicola sp.]